MGHNVSEQLTDPFFRVKIIPAYIFMVQMVVDGSFQTSVPIYQVIRSNIPEDSNFRIYEFTLKS
jgi:hypothetical protein